jgi:hypothetical protein
MSCLRRTARSPIVFMLITCVEHSSLSASKSLCMLLTCLPEQSEPRSKASIQQKFRCRVSNLQYRKSKPHWKLWKQSPIQDVPSGSLTSLQSSKTSSKRGSDVVPSSSIMLSGDIPSNFPAQRAHNIDELVVEVVVTAGVVAVE